MRAGAEPPSGRVPRLTYIYLVGNPRTEDKIEVEVIIGADKKRTVLSKSSGVTCASVAARENYTVTNLSRDGKTAVLFWTSPSGGVDEVGFCDSLTFFFMFHGLLWQLRSRIPRASVCFRPFRNVQVGTFLPLSVYPRLPASLSNECCLLEHVTTLFVFPGSIRFHQY